MWTEVYVTHSPRANRRPRTSPSLSMAARLARAGAAAAAVAAVTAAASASAATAAAAAAPLPPLIRFNATLLAAAKARVAGGDAELAPAFTALVAAANASLAAGPWSVTFTTIPPALSQSPDRHVYQSFATYFWPCTFCCPLANAIDVSSNGPACVPVPAPCNATTGLPFADCDGLANDEMIALYHAPAWGELHAAVSALSLAYYFTGRDDFAAAAAAALRTWFLTPATAMAPTLSFSQSIPGLCTGRPQGVIDFSSGGAFVSMLDAVTLLRAGGTPAWGDADTAGMEAWAAAFLDWALTAPTAVYDWADEPNNHRTWINAMMLGTATWLGNTTVVDWVLAGVPALMASQIIADGELFLEARRSRGLTYSNMCLRGYLELAAAAAAARPSAPLAVYNLTAASGGSIPRALGFLTPFVTGGDCWPFEQFTGYDFGQSFWEAARQAAAVFGDPGYMDAACRVPPAAKGGAYDGDVLALAWPWPPTADVQSQPYCTARGIRPAAFTPGACAPPTGTPPACNFPPATGGDDPRALAALGGVAAVVVAAAVVVSRRAGWRVRRAAAAGGSGGERRDDGLGASPPAGLRDALLS
jgi:hypothetical protein